MGIFLSLSLLSNQLLNTALASEWPEMTSGARLFSCCEINEWKYTEDILP